MLHFEVVEKKRKVLLSFFLALPLQLRFCGCGWFESPERCFCFQPEQKSGIDEKEDYKYKIVITINGLNKLTLKHFKNDI